MNLTQRHQLHNYLFWAIVLGLILFSSLLVLPFVGAIISAFILAFLVKPIYLKLRPRLGNNPAALLCLIISIFLVVMPIIFISLQILNDLGGFRGEGFNKIVDGFLAQPFLKTFNIDTVGLKTYITYTLDAVISSFFQSIPTFSLALFITLNGMFYLLISWDELISHLQKYLPFKNKDRMITELEGTTNAIIHGHVLVSLLEGAIAFAGFSLFGIQGALIFAVLIFILAFVPSVGPFLIWGPLALYYFSINQYVTMLGVIAIGLFLMIGIEFIFYTRFVGKRAQIHPFIMLIGVLGGITLFGVFGFIIGPLLLANSIKIIERAIETPETGSVTKKMANNELITAKRINH